MNQVPIASDPMTRTLRVALVDDEPPALRRLRLAIEKAPGAEVVGQAANGEEALALIRRGGIDVVLLDIRMPGLSGLDLARAIDPERAPIFIFVTAFSRFATASWRASAAKPVSLCGTVTFAPMKSSLWRWRIVSAASSGFTASNS